MASRKLTIAQRIERLIRKRGEMTPEEITRRLRGPSGSTVRKEITRLRRKGIVATDKGRILPGPSIEIRVQPRRRPDPATWLADRLAVGKNPLDAVDLLIREQWPIPGEAATPAGRKRIIDQAVKGTPGIIDCRASTPLIVKRGGPAAPHEPRTMPKWLEDSTRGVVPIDPDHQYGESYDRRTGTFRPVLRTRIGSAIRVVDVEKGGGTVPEAIGLQPHTSGGVHYYVPTTDRLSPGTGRDEGFDRISRQRGWYHEFLTEADGTERSPPLEIDRHHAEIAAHRRAWYDALTIMRKGK